MSTQCGNKSIRLLPFEPLAFEQGVTLAEDIQNGIDITGDAGQMKQLIAILLDNACKYAGNEKRQKSLCTGSMDKSHARSEGDMDWGFPSQNPSCAIKEEKLHKEGVAKQVADTIYGILIRFIDTIYCAKLVFCNTLLSLHCPKILNSPEYLSLSAMSASNNREHFI